MKKILIFMLCMSLLISSVFALSSITSRYSDNIGRRIDNDKSIIESDNNFIIEYKERIKSSNNYYEFIREPENNLYSINVNPNNERNKPSNIIIKDVEGTNFSIFKLENTGYNEKFNRDIYSYKKIDVNYEYNEKEKTLTIPINETTTIKVFSNNREVNNREVKR